MLLARELAGVVEQAISHMPGELREVIVLRDMEGMSYEQIARIAGCPLGTVKSRLNAARGRLRAVVLEWQGEQRP